MKKPVVMLGMGEMGGVFARALLRAGYPVVPALRETDLEALAEDYPEPEMIVVSVAEADIQTVLQTIPLAWRSDLVLLQNELLPPDWTRHGLEPTVISVWFEKKKGKDYKVLIPSPVYGKHATAIVTALATIDIPARELDSEDELLHELVLKNVYILTTNIAGLEVGGNVGELWDNNEQLAREVAGEVVELQQMLTGKSLDRELLIDGMVHAFQGDLEHMCMGRSAPARLERALKLAAKNGLRLLRLETIANQ